MMASDQEFVYVLDDSDEDFDSILEALRKHGRRYSLRRAVTGEEFMVLLQQEYSKGLPTLLLLDLNTPGMDGRETLAALKTDGQFKSLPVVVFTTSSNPRDIESCYENGANAYHVKPVEYGEYMTVLDNLFRYWLKDVTHVERA